MTEWGDERHNMTDDPTVLARGRNKRRTRRFMVERREGGQKKKEAEAAEEEERKHVRAHRKECGSEKIDEGGKDNHYNTCFEGAISTSCLNTIPFKLGQSHV